MGIPHEAISHGGVSRKDAPPHALQRARIGVCQPHHSGMTACILTCRRVTCQEAWSTPFWKGIVDDYAREVSYPDLPADPNWDRYLELEAAGLLRPISFFDGETARPSLSIPLEFRRNQAKKSRQLKELPG